MIEKIPFLGLPRISRKKEVQYIGITAIQKLDGEEHFILEVYKNDKAFLKEPLVRIVVCEKDYGNYWPDNKKWSSENIMKDEYCLIWQKYDGTRSSDKKRDKHNILYSEEDLKKIESFFNKYKVWNKSEWWEYIKAKQRDISKTKSRNSQQRRYEKRQRSLEERINNTPELPEDAILKWADGELFHAKHYLYYKKNGRKATICCSSCGGVKEGAWKAGDTYESIFETKIDEPKDKHFGICPLCGARGEYKSQGKVKWYHSEKYYVFKAERYQDTGAVIRYIEIEKTWVLEKYIEKDKELMNGSYEKLEGIEIARTYFHKGKVQTDYHKHNPYTGKVFWDDCNLYGMNNITVNEGVLYPGFSESLRGTDYQYSSIENFAAEVGNINAKKYMESYHQIPQIEMLVKLKLFEIVKELINGSHAVIANAEAKRLDDFLGINKDRIKKLIEKRGEKAYLNVMRLEKELKQKWTEEQIEALTEITVDRQNLETALGIMSLQKLLNQIKRYAGCEFNGCSSSRAQINHVAITYFDYLSMRLQLGYDMENTVYQRPRDLQAAHNRMAEEIDKEKNEERYREVAQKYPLIKKNYRKLRKRFLYEDEKYIIRPARSAEEIVKEGRLLHHCVGGNNYLSKHNKQDSIILMLRFKEQPEIPYITVEIRGNNIIQWYGANDRKPDKENMQQWLDAYMEVLRNRDPLNELRNLDLATV